MYPACDSAFDEYDARLEGPGDEDDDVDPEWDGEPSGVWQQVDVEESEGE